MKKLTEADYELLRSRGKVVSLTTSRDFDMPKSEWSVEKSKQAESRIKRVKKVKKSNKKHELVGTLLHTSWGYDMTMNDFCKIVEVSPTGKTVKCRMVTTKTNGLEYACAGTGKASAGETMVGPYFRLKVSSYGDNTPSFNGSYPFCGAENIPLNAKKSEYSNRMGYFGITSKTDSYYENHVD